MSGYTGKEAKEFFEDGKKFKQKEILEIIDKRIEKLKELKKEEYNKDHRAQYGLEAGIIELKEIKKAIEELK